ncbi:esterase/lipase family protein [Roseateles oligotrophus]|uniref:Alpha/beta fold hydrolase n=1 Tax=Roseateles oligotrophus TaxID=1769250 RepID=A0ABT2YHF3_9BURK|nr:alpha/beta fold hydrolase [Roseateles oligotrophus]MCV2369486.1 alpha/beta fold hydrolase [Roseateles oligotrophus]
MNAWIQRGLMGLKLLLCMLALLWGWNSGSVALGIFLVALIFGLGGAVIFLSFAALSRINRLAAIFRPAPLLRAWLREWLACERVFSWQQPFAEFRYPDNLPAGASERGVLLLHGFTCNRGLWNPWMRGLRKKGTPFVALTLEPAFGSIDAYADQIEVGVQALLALSGLPPVIVAHSMGGLAVRAWLRRYGHSQQGAAPAAHIMTLGSPHSGTWMAQFSPAVNSRQMRRGSIWLATLARDESPELAARFTCYFSYFDQVVCPARADVLPGSRSIEVAESGHLSMLFDDQIFSDLQHLLSEKSPEASG